MWEPTTRGVEQTDEFCHYQDCKHLNSNINFYVLDNLGARYFCNDHWELISFLFKQIRICEEGCKRNHVADWDKTSIDFECIKYLDKWYTVCDTHLEIYEDCFINPY